MNCSIGENGVNAKYQRGNNIVAALILVVALGFMFACYNPDKVPNSIRGALPEHEYSNNNSDKPSNLYTVQVMATPIRENAFAYQRALMRDGYAARVETSHYGSEGIYYKIRIGKYESRGEAIGVKDRIQRMYTNFNDSFVYKY